MNGDIRIIHHSFLFLWWLLSSVHCPFISALPCLTLLLLLLWPSINNSIIFLSLSLHVIFIIEGEKIKVILHLSIYMDKDPRMDKTIICLSTYTRKSNTGLKLRSDHQSFDRIHVLVKLEGSKWGGISKLQDNFKFHFLSSFGALFRWYFFFFFFFWERQQNVINQIVRWSPPRQDLYKLNTDGSSHRRWEGWGFCYAILMALV